MYSREVVVKNTIGIHARPLSFFYEEANKFKSSIWLGKEDEDRRVNAKSMMGVLSLNIAYGERIKILADGSDEREAAERLADLIESGFENR